MSATISSIEGINRLLSSPKLTPRDAIRLREQLIGSGIKGTTLTLGTVSPEVIKQLEFQKSINRDPNKKASLQNEIDLLTSQGRVSSFANTSNVPKDVAVARAKEIISKQQGFTKEISSQIRINLDSPEFKLAKSRGASLSELNVIAQKDVTPASKLNVAIVNELAQAKIQGKTITEQNIQNLLSREGINSTATVNLDSSPLGATLITSNEGITNFLGNITDTTGIKTGFPPELQGFPFVSGSTLLPHAQEEAKDLLSELGTVINGLLGTDINPQILGAVTIFVGVGIVLVILGAVI